MIRLFKRHDKRRTILLDGMWQFKTDSDAVGVKEEWYKNFPANCNNIIVPSCWNHELNLYHYEGICWYKTTFTTEKTNINLVFHGVTGVANVYLDGVLIGNHYGGFTGFSFELKNIEKGLHSLVVSVDNTHDDLNTIPLSVVDWFHYGGITRSVEVMELDDVWIKDYKIDYELNEELTDVNLSFTIILSGLNNFPYKRTLKIFIDNELLCKQDVCGSGEIQVNIRDIVLNHIKLWDVGNAHLYYFKFEIEDDDVTERIGFRRISIKDRKIILNKKEIKIKGINRHEDHPDWGFAMPVKLMKKDLEIIKQMGCNAIRGSHYPNAPVFLDMCDEQGVLFWEEIPMWGFPEKALENPLILERGLMMHQEMVKRDYHHPSVIIWGMHNEVSTETQAAFDLTKAFAKQLRSMDKSRLITYATNRPLEDICYSLADIVCANVYIGWYDSELSEWPDFFKKLEQKLKDEGLSNMPIIMSEFGAGGIYGDKSFEERKWSENYQAEYLDYTLELFGKMECIAGTFIWQYCDIRTPKENELSRPRSFNNKGVLNEYRNPKLAYWVVEKRYNS